MNKSIQNQRGGMSTRTILGIVGIVILVALYFVTKNNSSMTPVQTPSPTQAVTQVTILIPDDLTAYSKAMSDFVSNGGTDPSKTWKFDPKVVSVNPSSDILRATVDAVANNVSTGGGPLHPTVIYFKVVNSTAYVVLDIDIDGWAGVSFTLANIRPIFERSLLQYPQITSVKFGVAPGDNIDDLRHPAPTSTAAVVNFKTFSNTQYGFTFNYPSDWQTNAGSYSKVAGLYFIPLGMDSTFTQKPVLAIQIYSGVKDLKSFSQFNSLKGNTKSILVAGVQASEITSIGENGQPAIAIGFVKGGNGFVMSSFDSKGQSTVDTARQIIDSFKFIN